MGKKITNVVFKTKWMINLIGIAFISMLLGDLFFNHSKPWIRLVSYFLNYWRDYPDAIIFEILLLICGIGLIKLKNWARLGAIIICWWVYILHIPYYWGGKNIMNTEQLFALLLMILIIFILTRPKIKEQFK